MKKLYTLTSFFVVGGVMLSLLQGLQSRSNGNITAYTGAPRATTGNESTCTSCHNGTNNSGPHSVAISITGNPSGFNPGQAYTVTAKIVNPTGTRAGFSLVCLNPAKASCGTFTVGTGTRILTTTGTTGRSYINHSGTSLKSWTFTWTAPTTNVPDSVTFYMAGLEVTTADYTYTGKLVFHRIMDAAPSLNTTAISGLTQTTVNAGGNITSDGGHAVTERGVCWSESPAPTTSLSTKTSNGTGTGAFTSSVTGLSPSTTYHLRSYAVNSIGTSYGQELTFTTPSCQYLGNINGPLTVTCANPSTTLSIGAGGGTLLWSTGETTSSITVNPTVQTNYFVVGSLANGCSDTAFVTINVDQTAPPVPALTAPAASSICAGSAALQSSAASGNQWTNNGAPVAGATGQSFYPLQSGTYSVTVTNPLNGCSSTAQVTVPLTVLPMPVITQQPAAQSVQVGQDVQISVGSGGAGYQYRWQSGTAGQFSDLQDGAGISGSSNDTLTLHPSDLTWNGNSYRCIVTDGSCSDTTNAVALSVLTGIRAELKSNAIEVYPNPVRGQFFFKGASDRVDYSILSVSRKVMHKGVALQGKAVSVAGLPAGCYFWQAVSAAGQGQGRLINE